MSDLQEEDEIINDLAIMMRGKLRANCHKHSWRGNASFEYLMYRLQQEVDELSQEIKQKRPGKIRMECADIANIAAMIADIAKEGGNNGTTPEK